MRDKAGQFVDSHAESVRRSNHLDLDLAALGITTVLPQEFSGQGALSVSAGGVLIFGRWQGDIKVNGALIIASSAIVAGGHIQAQTIYLAGRLATSKDDKAAGGKATVHAAQLILCDGSWLDADASCNVLSVGNVRKLDGHIQTLMAA